MKTCAERLTRPVDYTEICRCGQPRYGHHRACGCVRWDEPVPAAGAAVTDSPAASDRTVMAGVEIQGFEELRRNTEHICKGVLDSAIQAAEAAAAQVIRQAVEASAPQRTGQLAKSVIVYESVNRKALTGSARGRLFVGPEKRKGFSGYFYNFGRKGQAARPWFETASASVESQATEAGIAAFQAVIEQKLGR